MDEVIRELHRRAEAGDKTVLQELAYARARIGLDPRLPAKKPSSIESRYLRKETLDLPDLDIVIDEETHQLNFSVDCYYEIDGADVRPTYWDPGDSAAWLLYHVVIAEDSDVVSYNEEALKDGWPILQLQEGDDLYPYLTKSQQNKIAGILEAQDREPDYPEPDDFDFDPDF